MWLVSEIKSVSSPPIVNHEEIIEISDSAPNISI